VEFDHPVVARQHEGGNGGRQRDSNLAMSVSYPGKATSSWRNRASDQPTSGSQIVAPGDSRSTIDQIVAGLWLKYGQASNRRGFWSGWQHLHTVRHFVDDGR
jgi:hypothetical protein